MLKQSTFKIKIMFKQLLKKLSIRLGNKAIETSNYRLLRMNRKLSFKQNK